MSRQTRIWAAFATIYVVWGSTYFAIGKVVESIPPLTAMGARFALAGTILLIVGIVSGGRLPSSRQWGAAIALGALFFLGANGAVAWAEAQGLPTGTAALLVATMPLWMTIISAVAPGAGKPTRRAWIGTAIGFVGVALLVDPELGVPMFPALLVVCGAASWATGSMLTRYLDMPSSAPVAAGAPMITGGVLMLGVGGALGEPAARLLEASAVSLGAMAYLVVVGSIVAFSAYAYLLRNVQPAKVATYAYVNPVVAVALGALAGEAIALGSIVAMVLVVAGVALTISARPTQAAKGSRSTGEGDAVGAGAVLGRGPGMNGSDGEAPRALAFGVGASNGSCSTPSLGRPVSRGSTAAAAIAGGRAAKGSRRSS